MNKLLFVAFIVGSALASTCPANPFFYMSGMTPHIETATVPTTTHRLCPTTFNSDKPSCCTEAYLDQAEALLDRRTMAYSAAGELVKSASAYIPKIKGAIDTFKDLNWNHCAALEEGDSDTDSILENAVDAITADFTYSAVGKAVDALSTYQTTLIDAFKTLLGKYAKLQHGAVCASCIPDIQLSIPANTYGSLKELFGTYSVTMKKSSEIKEIFTDDVFDAIANISTAFNSVVPDNLADSDVVKHFAAQCTQDSSLNDLQKAQILKDVLTKFATTPIEVKLPTATEILEQVTEQDLYGLFGVGVEFAEKLLESSYGANAADIEKGVGEMRAYFKRCVSHPLSSYCMNPNNTPKIFSELSDSVASFTKSNAVVEYRKKVSDYTMQEINDGIAELDLFRLIGMMDENLSGIALLPTLKYVESGDDAYEGSTQPLALAETSEIKYEERVITTIDTSAANGFGLLAGIFVLLVTIFA